jgi:hypothetical protein
MVLQLLILWDRNDYYRKFNLLFAVSILFKALQILVASVPHAVLVCVCIYIHTVSLYSAYAERPLTFSIGSLVQPVWAIRSGF